MHAIWTELLCVLLTIWDNMSDGCLSNVGEPAAFYQYTTLESVRLLVWLPGYRATRSDKRPSKIVRVNRFDPYASDPDHLFFDQEPDMAGPSRLEKPFQAGRSKGPSTTPPPNTIAPVINERALSSDESTVGQQPKEKSRLLGQPLPPPAPFVREPAGRGSPHSLDKHQLALPVDEQYVLARGSTPCHAIRRPARRVLLKGQLS
jgi:hypothetical protein